MGFSIKKRYDTENSVNLPLTPMADVFVVLLLFMLKSFSFDTSVVAPNAEISLPEAQGKEQAIADIRLELGREGILLNDKKIVSLDRFQFPPEALDASGSVTGLKDALSVEASAHRGIASKVVLMADKSAPYATVKTVLSTVLDSGMSELQIAVSQEAQ